VNQRYRGRFAPSPTGPLHFGSLVAAAGSYLDARSRHGEWLVRMEDVDTRRCFPNWSDDILRTLEVFGFEWDGEVLYQSSSDRQECYAAAIDQLTSKGVLYPCGCSRREILDSQTGPWADHTARYPGTCRNGLGEGKTARAWRLRVDDDPVGFTDRFCGFFEQRLESSVGDFVLKRSDGPFAYQLAVVVDDAKQAITDVVRGADLLDSTPRQIYLQRQLGFRQPRYLHLPVATNGAGQKLSKQTGAEAISASSGATALCDTMAFLGLAPPAELRHAKAAELWAWATGTWLTLTQRGGQRYPDERAKHDAAAIP